MGTRVIYIAFMRLPHQPKVTSVFSLANRIRGIQPPAATETATATAATASSTSTVVAAATICPLDAPTPCQISTLRTSNAICKKCFSLKSCFTILLSACRC